MGLTARALGSPTHPLLSYLKYAKRNLIPWPYMLKASLGGVNDILVSVYVYIHMNDGWITDHNANAVFFAKKLWAGTHLGGAIAASSRCHATSGHIRWRGDRKFHLPFPHGLCQEREKALARQERAMQRFAFLMYCGCRVWLLLQPHHSAASIF